MKILRAGRYGRIIGLQREKAQRVRLTQTYQGCDCVEGPHERTAGSGHKFPNRCEAHGNLWAAVHTQVIEEDE